MCIQKHCIHTRDMDTHIIYSPPHTIPHAPHSSSWSLLGGLSSIAGYLGYVAASTGQPTLIQPPTTEDIEELYNALQFDPNNPQGVQGVDGGEEEAVMSMEVSTPRVEVMLQTCGIIGGNGTTPPGGTHIPPPPTPSPTSPQEPPPQEPPPHDNGDTTRSVASSNSDVQGESHTHPNTNTRHDVALVEIVGVGVGLERGWGRTSTRVAVRDLFVHDLYSHGQGVSERILTRWETQGGGAAGAPAAQGSPPPPSPHANSVGVVPVFQLEATTAAPGSDVPVHSNGACLLLCGFVYAVCCCVVVVWLLCGFVYAVYGHTESHLVIITTHVLQHEHTTLHTTLNTGTRIGVVVQPLRIVFRVGFLLGLTTMITPSENHPHPPPHSDAPRRWVVHAVNRLVNSKSRLLAKAAMAGVGQPPEVHVQVRDVLLLMPSDATPAPAETLMLRTGPLALRSTAHTAAAPRRSVLHTLQHGGGGDALGGLARAERALLYDSWELVVSRVGVAVAGGVAWQGGQGPMVWPMEGHVLEHVRCKVALLIHRLPEVFVWVVWCTCCIHNVLYVHKSHTHHHIHTITHIHRMVHSPMSMRISSWNPWR